MAYFQVLLHGADFVFNFDGIEEKGGFYTTRWVKANSENEAELKAVSLLKSDQNLHDVSVKTERYTPMIFLEEIAKVNWFNYVRNYPGKGYTFYTGDDDS
ncbi:hypothetical protein [Neptunicella sp. SCSIO 80796]|uniref:hypothetical protein n=1 Tax=Neptunicella plasticusilytica TaxID=3117012 RepID=UPI003A4D655D